MTEIKSNLLKSKFPIGWGKEKGEYTYEDSNQEKYVSKSPTILDTLETIKYAWTCPIGSDFYVYVNEEGKYFDSRFVSLVLAEEWEVNLNYHY